MNNLVKLMLCVPLAGCAGGTETAAQLPTPILCQRVLDMSPIYVRYNEWVAELNRRGVDCAQYVGDTINIRRR